MKITTKINEVKILNMHSTKKILKIIKKSTKKYIELFNKSKLTKNGKKQGRPIKYDIDTCLNIIFELLAIGGNWLHVCKHMEKYAYTSIYKRYRLWIENGIFSQMYAELNKIYCSNRVFKELFIDSTDCLNLNGSTNYVNFGYKFKNKNALKISIIGDENNVPLYYSVDKSSNHDNKIMKQIVNKIDKFNDSVELIADKGYQNDDKFKNKLFKEKNIKLIHPKRRTNKNEYCSKKTKLGKKMLRRLSIEHLNNRIHRSFKRIDRVYEKKYIIFDTFLKIAFSCLIIEKIDTNSYYQ